MVTRTVSLSIFYPDVPHRKTYSDLPSELLAFLVKLRHHLVQIDEHIFRSKP